MVTETREVTFSNSQTGTKLSGGKYYEEYLGTLKSKTGAENYDKMRRSDYQVQRMLRALNAPILSANFIFEPVDPTSPQQVKQALFKNNVYGKWLKHSFMNTKYEILSYLMFGYSIFEPYWYYVKDKEFGDVLTIKNMGFLSQKTIDQWYIDKGDISSVVQTINMSDMGKTGSFSIPGENLIVFTNQREGDNFEGISILRAAYGNYVRKDLYLKLDMIGNEKMAVGVPVIYLPRSIYGDVTESDTIRGIMEAYVTHQSSYIQLPDLLKDGGFEIKKGEYDSSAIDTAIKREDAAMVDSILASFLNIGTQRAGGNAQNEGHQTMFLQAEMYIAEYMAEKLDILAHKAYALNFGEPEVTLKMKVKGILQDSIRDTMEIIRGYSSSNLIEPDDILEETIRKNLDLPRKDKTTTRQSNQTKEDSYAGQPDVEKSILKKGIVDNRKK